MSFDLVFFGGTGDLVWRKLMPALFQAFRHGTLPEGGRIIGVARDSMSDEQYRTLIQSRFEQVEGRGLVVGNDHHGRWRRGLEAILGRHQPLRGCDRGQAGRRRFGSEPQVEQPLDDGHRGTEIGGEPLESQLRLAIGLPAEDEQAREQPTWRRGSGGGGWSQRPDIGAAGPLCFWPLAAAKQPPGGAGGRVHWRLAYGHGLPGPHGGSV